MEDFEVIYYMFDGNYLYIQSCCDGGYDYTLYSQDFQGIDGGQLDNPDILSEAATKEIMDILGYNGAQKKRLIGEEFYEAISNIEEGQTGF